MSALPERISLTRYRTTGKSFPAASTGVGVAFEWCQERMDFSLEDLMAEIDFVDPDQIRQAMSEAEVAGAIIRTN